MLNDSPFGRIEVNIEDYSTLATILLRNGYDVLCRQDGESLNVVMIDFVHPEYTGECFERSHNYYEEGKEDEQN